MEIVGKECWRPRVTIWRPPNGAASVIESWQHSFIDRDKPATGTDILAADVDGDGHEDVICARWWYRSPDWERLRHPRHLAGHLRV